jgi:hypothetical protein
MMEIVHANRVGRDYKKTVILYFSDSTQIIESRVSPYIPKTSFKSDWGRVGI